MSLGKFTAGLLLTLLPAMAMANPPAAAASATANVSANASANVIQSSPAVSCYYLRDADMSAFQEELTNALVRISRNPAAGPKAVIIKVEMETDRRPEYMTVVDSSGYDGLDRVALSLADKMEYHCTDNNQTKEAYASFYFGLHESNVERGKLIKRAFLTQKVSLNPPGQNKDSGYCIRAGLEANGLVRWDCGYSGMCEIKKWEQPDYPREELHRGIGGTADVTVTLRADSSVADARILRSTGNAALDTASMAAARKSKYTCSGSNPSRSVDVNFGFWPE